MLSFFISLWANPLARKIIQYGGIALIVLLMLRWYGNRQWSKGVEEGRRDAAASISESKKAEWRAKENEIEATRLHLADLQADLKADQTDLRRERANLSKSFQETLAIIRDERISQYANASAVAADELNDALRLVSAGLATAATPDP